MNSPARHLTRVGNVSASERETGPTITVVFQRGPLAGRRDYVPPGWDEWDVVGNGYAEYDYRLNHDGHPLSFGHKPGNYLTDVLSDAGDRFVRSAAAPGSSSGSRTARPFFLEVATFAPHIPSTLAPRDRSLTGRAKPCSTGPIAWAPARYCVSL